MTQITGEWLTDPDTQKVLGMLTDAGFQALVVGGCVRNALLDVPVSDVDIATNALPKQVIEIAETANLKAIPTGIDHGTITVVAGGIPHEITTFRKDVETTGRHAVVAFSDNIEDDAKRRDFTMNALYADAQGNVIDPLNGIPDLENRRVRFIEDPAQRIAEDYLRILRFFRFHAWYGDQKNGPDAEGLAAISAALDGLADLSKERVGAEMLKLLSAKDPAPAVATMAQSGVLSRVLPGSDNRALAPLVHLESDLKTNPIRRLAVLGGEDVADILRLSKVQTRNLETIIRECGEMKPVKALGYLHGAPLAIDIALVRAALLETRLEPDFQTQAAEGAENKFPVTAKDLMPNLQGAELGARLKALENEWISSDFMLSKTQLLSR